MHEDNIIDGVICQTCMAFMPSKDFLEKFSKAAANDTIHLLTVGYFSTCPYCSPEAEADMRKAMGLEELDLSTQGNC